MTQEEDFETKDQPIFPCERINRILSWYKKCEKKNFILFLLKFSSTKLDSNGMKTEKFANCEENGQIF